jgi:hypothetical protein
MQTARRALAHLHGDPSALLGGVLPQNAGRQTHDTGLSRRAGAARLRVKFRQN